MNPSLEPSPALREIVSRLRACRKSGQLVIQAGDEGLASAPSNIALIKYWGKLENPAAVGGVLGASTVPSQIPVSSSLSRNLEGFRSFTKAVALSRTRETLAEDAFDKPAHRFVLETSERGAPNYGRGEGAVTHGGGEGSTSGPPHDPSQDWNVGPKLARFLEAFFAGWAPEVAVAIESRNNFPTGCGVASSASGYAALVGALTDMAGLQRLLPPSELAVWLSEWARLGSGSATRSALATRHSPGFVAWQLSDPSDLRQGTTTYEVEVHPEMLQVEHLLAVVSSAHKEVSSSDGHLAAKYSLFQRLRVAGLEPRFHRLVQALRHNDFDAVRVLVEEDSFAMHAVMATGQPPLNFMLQGTVDLLEAFLRERASAGWSAMWTLDAGPNVHFLARPQSMPALRDFLVRWSRGRSVQIMTGDSKPSSAQGQGGLCLGDVGDTSHPHVLES